MQAADALSHHLWSLRQKLDDLVYALNVQQLFLASGRARFLQRAADQVHATADAVGDMDALVRAAAGALADAVGAEPGAPLSELAAHCQEPWGGVLAGHRLELARLRGEVENLVRLNKEAAKRAMQLTGEAIGQAEGYTPQGTEAPRLTRSRLDRTV